ncbi:MAG: response regulator [Desulfobulbus sp.]|jgi:DNA-binding NtrC family response regulator|uniref:response regulator n=1 Tax=Desulfobulbus sp. TaxID=895 RepID=UPI00284B9CEA|nr:response regulator [Desulfobulbus sp.]MDR2550161.1 response regulator [Desulfobulbus sp.]
MATNEAAAPLRILILDDEPIVCKRLKPAFQKLGHTVETFTDSGQALARLGEAVFDLVITDLKMEGADGLQILNGAKASSPATQVIVITGFATLETAKESYRKGAFDFVAKPFKLRDILDCVKRIEDRRRDLPADSGS